MPSTSKASSAAQAPIPIRPKLLRRFYEPIVLEFALKETRSQGFSNPRGTVNPTSDSIDDAQHAFQFFVNRLAQVCDDQRGGTTVSAIAVLEEPDCVHYILGSNNRKTFELQRVQEFARQLLNIVGRSQMPGSQITTVTKDTLWHILRFNKGRVRAYLGDMAKHLDDCIVDHKRRHSEDPTANDFRGLLFTLKERIKFRENPNLTEDLFFTGCEKLLKWINHGVQRSGLATAISVQARDGQFDRSEPWLELRHYVGRLHSYHLAVETIIRTSTRWSRLFHEVKVTAIPSASLAPNPFKTRKLNAHDIIGRMVPAEQAVVFRAQVEKLQQFGLDNAIQQECESSSKHMVHCEVQVLDYVLTYLKGHDAINFWNNWRYIGASKPTCRLCNYYFMAHPSGVRVRESHGNLYPHWRVPDVFDVTVEQQRDLLLNTVVKKIREDAKRSIQYQKPQGREHDSNSFSDMPRHFVTGQTENASISDITSSIGALDISSGRSTVQLTAVEEDARSVDGNAAGSDGEEEVTVCRKCRSSPKRRG